MRAGLHTRSATRNCSRYRGGVTRAVHVYLTADEHERILSSARRGDRSLSREIRRAIRYYLRAVDRLGQAGIPADALENPQGALIGDGQGVLP